MPSGRFAPSPTGRLHLGNLRTAVVAWLLARADQSRFMVRFDDLDTGAVRSQHYETQLADLEAIGLDWDAPPVRQSDRLDLYRVAVKKLVDEDRVYPCWCSRKEIRQAAQAPNHPLAGHEYPGTCRDLGRSERERRQHLLGRPPALRLRTEPAFRMVEVFDQVCGPTRVEVDDFVVCRNDATPAYHLVTVIDDSDMGVELVVRGDDLLDSTARHMLVAEALGLDPIPHAHIPLVLNGEQRRLAKRDGAVTLPDRQALGETPSQVFSFLAASLGLCRYGTQVSPQDLASSWSIPDILAALPSQPLVFTDLSPHQL